MQAATRRSRSGRLTAAGHALFLFAAIGASIRPVHAQAAAGPKGVVGAPVTLQLQSGTARFTASATLGDFSGLTARLRGTVTSAAGFLAATGWVTVQLDSLDTGNGRRNGHMRDALEVEAFPVARFDLDSIRRVGSAAASDQEMARLREAPGLDELLRTPLLAGDVQAVRLHGQFTVHGVRRPVVAFGALQETPNGEWRLVALFPVTLADHGISKGLSRMLGTIKVRPVVGVRITATFAAR